MEQSHGERKAIFEGSRLLPVLDCLSIHLFTPTCNVLLFLSGPLGEQHKLTKCP